MRKILLMSSALALSSGVAEAACIQTPTCGAMGYDSTVACEGGIKCPFGNAWNCTLADKIAQLEITIEKLEQTAQQEALAKCKIGDILYHDMSCNTNVVASKTPIGVIFDVTNGLAIAKDEFTNFAWGMSGDISGIQNYANSSTSVADWQGFSNTKAIYDYEKSQGGYYPSMEKVLLYSTTGTSQGQWYLPAAGELQAISTNKDTLNETLAKIGGTQMSGNYWSSSEQDSNNVWQITLGGSLSNTRKSYRGTAKPIINFISKDKIDIELTDRSTACKVGDILYSDKTCSASVVSGKMPIGVVFNGPNRLAVALSDTYIRLQGSHNNIPGITNYTNGSQAKQDYNGKVNTAAIKAYDSDLSDFPAAGYAYNYTTSGTKAGDWYLPALGELNEIYSNKNVLNTTLRKIGGTTFSFDYYWSSSEGPANSVWFLMFSDGDVSYTRVNGYNGYVRPVLAF